MKISTTKNTNFTNKKIYETSLDIPINSPLRLWLARLLIAYVLVVNLQAAVLFLIQPEAYAPGFELSGAAGEGMLRGMGLLFLMWNVPYAVALSHPLKRRVSLIEALVMQAIGVFGETLLLLSFPPGHPALVELGGTVYPVRRHRAGGAGGCVIIDYGIFTTETLRS